MRAFEDQLLPVSQPIHRSIHRSVAPLHVMRAVFEEYLAAFVRSSPAHGAVGKGFGEDEDITGLHRNVSGHRVILGRSESGRDVVQCLVGTGYAAEAPCACRCIGQGKADHHQPIAHLPTVGDIIATMTEHTALMVHAEMAFLTAFAGGHTVVVVQPELLA